MTCCSEWPRCNTTSTRRPKPPRRRADRALAVVRTVDVSKEFADGDRLCRALEPLTLTVEPGEFLAVMGPSGCGKTTLLRLVAGLARPSSGTIEVDGRALHAMSE